MNVISFTKSKLPYGWLGNMSPFSLVTGKKWKHVGEWRTAEALFQAMRFPMGHPIVDQIKAEKSPMGAKFVAKASKDQFDTIPLSDQDVQNMANVLILKTIQHEFIRKELLLTGDATLIEDVSSRRNKGAALFWGAARNDDGSWEGINILGFTWMNIRRDLKAGSE